jgi:hypothetical protein
LTRDDFDDAPGWPAESTRVYPSEADAIPAGVSRRTQASFLAYQRKQKENDHPYTAWCSCWRCEAGRRVA